MTELLSSGFVDSFRYVYPDKTDAYSWWSYMRNAREKILVGELIILLHQKI